MTIFDFVNRYCLMYELTEDELTTADVVYIEDVFYSYCDNGDVPDFMRTN